MQDINNQQNVSKSLTGKIVFAFILVIVIIAGTIASTSIAITLEKTNPEPTTQAVSESTVNQL